MSEECEASWLGGSDWNQSNTISDWWQGGNNNWNQGNTTTDSDWYQRNPTSNWYNRESDWNNNSREANEIFSPAHLQDDDEREFMNKLNRVRTWGGSELLYPGSQDDYTAFEESIEKMTAWEPLSPGLVEETHEYQKFMCEEYFQVIQRQFPEMADYEFVEHISMNAIIVSRPIVHLNLKAKRKGEDESSAVIYFAELDLANQEPERVKCFSELCLNDPMSLKCCTYCHTDCDAAVTGGDDVYHPDGGFYGAIKCK